MAALVIDAQQQSIVDGPTSPFDDALLARKAMRGKGAAPAVDAPQSMVDAPTSPLDAALLARKAMRGAGTTTTVALPTSPLDDALLRRKASRGRPAPIEAFGLEEDEEVDAAPPAMPTSPHGDALLRRKATRAAAVAALGLDVEAPGAADENTPTSPFDDALLRRKQQQRATEPGTFAFCAGVTKATKRKHRNRRRGKKNAPQSEAGRAPPPTPLSPVNSGAAR